MQNPLRGLMSRLAQISNARRFLEHPPKSTPNTALDRELDRLIERTEEIGGLAEWAVDPRGEAYRDALAEEVAKLMIALPDAVLTQKDTAVAMAAMIKTYGNALRIFNSPVLEYERVRLLVDKRLGSIGDDNA